MLTPKRLLFTLATALLLALTACGTTPTTPDPTPRAPALLPQRPLLALSITPDKVTPEQRETFTDLLQNTDNPDPTIQNILHTLLSPKDLVAMGISTTESIRAALLPTPGQDLLLTGAQGNLLHLLEFPGAAPIRVVLPSKDPQTTHKALFRTATQSWKLQGPAQYPQSHTPIFLTSPHLQAKLWHTDNTVVLDLSIQTRGAKEARQIFETLSESYAQGSKPQTAAWKTFQNPEKDTSIALYTDMDLFLVGYQLLAMRHTAAAFKNTTAQKANALSISAMSLLQEAARTMNPADRHVEDITWSIRQPRGSSFSLETLRTLRDDAAGANASNDQDTPPLYAPRGQKNALVFQQYQGLRPVIEAYPKTLWTQKDWTQSPFNTLLSGGTGIAPYFLLNEPSHMLDALGFQARYLPESVTLVLESVDQTEDKASVVGAAALVYKTGAVPTEITALVQQVHNTGDPSKVLPQLRELRLEEQETHTTLLVSLGKPVQDLLTLAPQKHVPHDFLLDTDTESLKQLLSTFGLHHFALKIPAQRAFTALDAVQGSCHITRWSSRGDRSAIQWPKACTEPQTDPLPLPRSPGQICQAELAAHLSQIAEAYLSIVPEQREKFHAAAQEALEEQFQCIAKDPLTSESETQTRAGWHQFSALVFAQWEDSVQALEEASKACQEKRRVACDMLKTPPGAVEVESQGKIR